MLIWYSFLHFQLDSFQNISIQSLATHFFLFPILSHNETILICYIFLSTEIDYNLPKQTWFAHSANDF